MTVLKPEEIQIGSATLQSRNAVETAISSSKEGSKTTWEGMAVQLRKTIQPWEAIARMKVAEVPDTLDDR